MANIFKCEICGRFLSYKDMDEDKVSFRHDYEWNGIDPETYEDVTRFAHKSCEEKQKEGGV